MKFGKIQITVLLKTDIKVMIVWYRYRDVLPAKAYESWSDKYFLSQRCKSKSNNKSDKSANKRKKKRTNAMNNLILLRKRQPHRSAMTNIID